MLYTIYVLCLNPICRFAKHWDQTRCRTYQPRQQQWVHVQENSGELKQNSQELWQQYWQDSKTKQKVHLKNWIPKKKGLLSVPYTWVQYPIRDAPSLFPFPSPPLSPAFVFQSLSQSNKCFGFKSNCISLYSNVGPLCDMQVQGNCSSILNFLS